MSKRSGRVHGTEALGGELQTHPSVRAIDKPLLAVPPWSSARPLGVTVAGPLADVTYE